MNDCCAGGLCANKTYRTFQLQGGRNCAAPALAAGR